MKTKIGSWQERFGLTSCEAAEIEQAMEPGALGVAVIYANDEGTEGGRVFLVIESRAGALREQCAKRLKTAKLPPVGELRVSFKAETLAEASAEAVHAACRRQVILAGELRRELRPAMR